MWNPESTALNPESKTLLDYLTWGEIETEDLDQAIAEVTGTFDGEEEIRVELREDTVIIFKGSIGYGKSLPFFQLLPGICSV